MSRKSLIILVILVISSIGALGFYIRPAKGILWIEGHITSDTTWTPVDTYRVINNTYVDPGVTLTILPGVQVQFADGFSLTVRGSLNATGTEVDAISFTSSRSSPSPGVWNTIEFQGNSSEQFLINHVKVEYAVHGVTIESLGSTTIEKSRIFNCSESGIYIIGESNVIIKENTIELNKNGISTDSGITHSGIHVVHNSIHFNDGNGIYLQSYSYSSSTYLYNILVSDNLINSNNGNGIYLDNAKSSSYSYNITFSNNTLLSNSGNGIYVRNEGNPSNVSNFIISGNTITANSENGVYLYSCSGYSYIHNVVFSNNNISSNNGRGIYFHCYGAYTYLYDISVSHNTVHSNYGSGIYMRSYGVRDYYVSNVGQSHFYNISVSNNAITFNNEDGIYLFSHGCTKRYQDSNKKGYFYNVSVSHNVIYYNNGKGLLAHGMHIGNQLYDLTMSYNTLSANVVGICISPDADSRFEGIRTLITNSSISYGTFGVQYTAESRSASKGNSAHFNNIYENTYGISVDSGATVDAEYNYWGHSTGPYHESLNPEGEGNPVNGDGNDLDFIPFLTSPIPPINERPIADLEVDKANPNVNETVTFDATGSTDDGRIDYYFFDFGDGTNSSWTTLPVVTHKYTVEGKYNATLIAMDDFGVTSLDDSLVYVEITVIPEFPSFMILPLFILVTSIVAVWAKKKASPPAKKRRRVEESEVEGNRIERGVGFFHR